MDQTNFAEYRVTKEVEGSYKAKRIAMQIGYGLFPILMLAVLAAIHVYLIFPGILLVFLYVALLNKLVKPLTWIYFNYDYYYKVQLGTFKVERIYSEAKRKVLVEKKVSDLETIAPYTGEYKKIADDPSITKRIEAVSTMKAKEIYFATFTDTDGKKAVVFFEPLQKTIKLMSFYNKNTVVTHVSM